MAVGEDDVHFSLMPQLRESAVEPPGVQDIVESGTLAGVGNMIVGAGASVG